MSQNTHAEITDLPQQPPLSEHETEFDSGTMADRLRGRPRNAAYVAERALEEIRCDGTFGVIQTLNTSLRMTPTVLKRMVSLFKYNNSGDHKTGVII